MQIPNNQLLKISFPPIILLALHVLVTKTGLYERFWWFDIPMHFAGGVLVAIALLFFFNHFIEDKKLTISSDVLKVLLIVALTTLFAFSWEVMEYSFDLYFTTGLQGSLTDTMKDISMGIMGAYVVSAITIFKSKR